MHLSLKYKILILITVIGLILYWNCLPEELFTDPTSTVLEDRKGNLLGAHIADDGQWRFPMNNNVPEKFHSAITLFEDKRYDYHPGFDPIALVRALITNIRAGSTVSGGSTLTMQVIRLSRKGKPRTVWEKLIEIVLATRLELSNSKEDILALYSSNAPFGGNVVGLDAAAWRYFGRSPGNLSWAETSMLAVLPNSPSLIHPGRNRKFLKKKRDRLLLKLYEENKIDKETYTLSLEEPIPEKPRPFPQTAPHLLARANIEYPAGNEKLTRVRSTIDMQLQERVNKVISTHHKRLSGNGIHNAAAIIIEVETGNVLAYAGNIIDINDVRHGSHVDIITSERSTGSILKPFLYAAMLTSGEILPNALVPDIPTNMGGYSPKNYNRGYDGAVKAKRALARSLNVPAIRLLKKYGIEKFIHILKKAGMTTVNKPADHYGLSLILGGSEGKLWELSGCYASMARTLNHYLKYNGKYNGNDYSEPVYLQIDTVNRNTGNECLEDASLFSAAAIWMTFNTMLTVERPPQESSWEYFSSEQRIAWKTGTSFGFRDGWAIGVTPLYVVGVWIGNADGEGRPELTGINTAAPVMFDIFDFLPHSKEWFIQPFDEMILLPTCRESGYIASEVCEHVDSIWVPETGLRFPKCPYHKLIHLDPSGRYRVHSDCESPADMQHVSWFILPPAMEWFYRSKNANYKKLPPYREDCINNKQQSSAGMMEVIYPKDITKIYVPVEMDGKKGSTIFEVAHREPGTTIFWHVDDEYICRTNGFHHIALSPEKGKHILTLIDENGEKLTQEFEIIDKEDK